MLCHDLLFIILLCVWINFIVSILLLSKVYHISKHIWVKYLNFVKLLDMNMNAKFNAFKKFHIENNRFKTWKSKLILLWYEWQFDYSDMYHPNKHSVINLWIALLAIDSISMCSMNSWISNFRNFKRNKSIGDINKDFIKDIKGFRRFLLYITTYNKKIQ